MDCSNCTDAVICILSTFVVAIDQFTK